MISQRYGDLEIGFTTDFTHKNEGDVISSGRFWHPIPPAGWWALGNQVTPNDVDPRGNHGALIVRQVSGASGLLAPPVDYQRIGQSVFWRPVPPEGYVALGDVFHQNHAEKPPLNAVACVKQTHQGRDYVRQAELSRERIWMSLSGALSAWAIVPPLYPDADTNEHLFVPVGLFTVAPEKPAPNEVTWVLDLPAVVDKSAGPATPQLHSHDEPPAQTTIVTDRTVTVPYFMIKDDGRTEKWKVDNSPFYKVLRKRHYELKLFRNNQQGSEPQTDSEAIETGVSTEQSEAFSKTTGMSVSVTAGVEVTAGAFGMGATASLSTTVSNSVELGYERRYGITTMEHITVTRSLTTPPKSSGALWMERHELLPVRADGALISTNAKLPFRTVYYHTGQYPSALKSGEQVAYAELDNTGKPLPQQIGIPVEDAKPEAVAE